MAVPAIGGRNRFRNTMLRSVDWGNPTTADLVACHVPIGNGTVKDLCGQLDLLPYRIGTDGTMPSNDTSSWSEGMTSSGAGCQGSVAKTGLSGPLSLQPPVSLMWVGRFNAEPSAGQYFYGVDHIGFGGTSHVYCFRKGSSAGRLTLACYQSAATVDCTIFGINPAFTSPIPRVIIGTIGPSGLALWLNGTLGATNATAVNVLDYSAGFGLLDGSHMCVGTRNGVSGLTSASTFNLGAVWNRQLTNAEIISLSADPFSFLNAR